MNSQSVSGAALLTAGGLILASLAWILFSGTDLGFYIAIQIGFVGVIAAFLLGVAGVIGGLLVTATAPHAKAHAPRTVGLRSAHCH
jgi:hypothetical protein